MQLSKKITPTLVELTTVSNYKHTEIIRHYGAITMQTALKSTSPSVVRLTKQLSKQQVVDAIAKIFIATAQYFDGELPANKANLVAEEILVNYEYGSFKLEDIVAICKELKEEAVYTKLTPSKILKHISEYNQRRIKQAIQNQLNKTQIEKGESNIDERVKKSVRHIEKSNEIVVKQRLIARKFTK